MSRLKWLVATLCYQVGPARFACGRRGTTPCAGHEYVGTIVDSRWGWR